MKTENIIFHFGRVLVDWSSGYLQRLFQRKKIVKRNIFLKTFVPKNGI
jgi:hypothetical protein